MNCASHAGVTAVAACTRCECPICDGCREKLDGRDYCTTCVAALRAKLAEPIADTAMVTPPPISPAAIVPDRGLPMKGVLFAGVAGLVGALVWYGVVVLTDMKLGLVAIGVGWLVGRGAVMGAEGGGKQLAFVSLAIAVLAMAFGEYLMVNHAVRAYFAAENPGEALPALLSPVMLFPIYGESFGVMDVVFYAIGAWEAFRIPANAVTHP